VYWRVLNFTHDTGFHIEINKKEWETFFSFYGSNSGLSVKHFHVLGFDKILRILKAL